MMDSMLVGDEFIRTAGILGAEWESALTEECVRVVVLRGGTGAGKTRLLQSLYEQVMAVSDAPEYPDSLALDDRGLPRDPGHFPAMRQQGAGRVRYWPPSLRTPPPAREANGVAFITAATPAWQPFEDEVLYPSGIWTPPPGSRLRVFWWGLRGQPPPGACAALVSSAQIDTHLAGLRQAIQDGDQLARKRVRVLLDASCWVNALASLALPPLAASGVIKTGLDVAGIIKDTPGLTRDLRGAFRTREGLIEAELKPTRLRELDLNIGRAGMESAEAAFRALAEVASILPFAVAIVDRSQFG